MKAMDLMDALGNVPLDLIPDGADASAEAKPVQQDAVPQAEIPKITQHDNPQMHNRPKAGFTAPRWMTAAALAACLAFAAGVGFVLFNRGGNENPVQNSLESIVEEAAQETGTGTTAPTESAAQTAETEQPATATQRGIVKVTTADGSAVQTNSKASTAQTDAAKTAAQSKTEKPLTASVTTQQTTTTAAAVKNSAIPFTVVEVNQADLDQYMQMQYDMLVPKPSVIDSRQQLLECAVQPAKDYAEDFFADHVLIDLITVFSCWTQALPTVTEVSRQGDILQIHADRDWAMDEALQYWSIYLEINKKDLEGMENPITVELHVTEPDGHESGTCNSPRIFVGEGRVYEWKRNFLPANRAATMQMQLDAAPDTILTWRTEGTKDSLWAEYPDKTVSVYSADLIQNVYFTDLNGDDVPEICINSVTTERCAFGEDMMQYVTVYDIANQKLYGLGDRFPAEGESAEYDPFNPAKASYVYRLYVDEGKLKAQKMTHLTMFDSRLPKTVRGTVTLSDHELVFTEDPA